MHAMEISLTALDVEWRRLEVIADNLANVGTVRTAAGGPFRAHHLVSGPKIDFKDYLDGNGKSAGVDPHKLSGVTVYSVEEIESPPRMVHEPGNPQADSDGFVAYPAIDHAQQMTLMIKTSRAYEANIVAMNTARQMYSKALDLGRRS
jgi:flagellar basal-body rod protein FlgC